MREYLYPKRVLGEIQELLGTLHSSPQGNITLSCTIHLQSSYSEPTLQRILNGNRPQRSESILFPLESLESLQALLSSQTRVLCL